jgi:radical SAM-linked protein
MKIRIKFAKRGHMKFIGHLDIMRYFQKAIRRANIDIAYSEGFSPHQIMSFASPLGVGLTSEGEYLDIEVHSLISSEQMKECLNQNMVSGMEVLSCFVLPDNAKNAMSIVAAADYLLTFPAIDAKQYSQLINDFGAFLQRDSIPVTKKTKKKEISLDIRPLIYQYSIEDKGIYLKIAAGSVNNLKPELILKAFQEQYAYSEEDLKCQVCRLELYADKRKISKSEENPVCVENLVSLESFGENFV